MTRYYKFGFIAICFLVFTTCKDNNSSTNDPDNFSHTSGVGTSANAFLSSATFTSLTIEVDYVTGYQPTDEAISNLKAFLEARLNKPGGISIFLDDEIPSPGDDVFTTKEVYNLEKTHRHSFTSGNNIAAYFLVLDGQYEQENVLGIAYLNTSMALFEKVIRENTGRIGRPSATTVESTVLMHEFGHLLGLVDNGSPALQDHVDEEHGAHCTNEDCLMYYATQTTGFLTNLTGGTIPALDGNCLQDLKANGGK